MPRLYIVFCGCLIGIVGCASGLSGGAQDEMKLDGTTLNFRAPKGFVVANYVSVYPQRPIRNFFLPELPTGGQPAYPELSIEQLPLNEGAQTLDGYIKKATGDAASTVTVIPHQMSIDGHPAIEFVISETMIADFTDGRSASGTVQHSEIALQEGSSIYRCVMESGPDSSKQYMKVFEDFCSSMRFKDSSKN